MRRRTMICRMRYLLAIGALAVAPTGAPGQWQQPSLEPGHPDTLRTTIDLGRTGDPIDPLMYGHFIENLRNWFERGMWAEMIGDRKFFYPVNDDSVQTPPNQRRSMYEQWSPIGPAAGVVMDSAHATSGDHVPRILLAGDERRGIAQPGLGVRADLGYEGRIVLAGDPGARVEVTLRWGDGDGDRQTVSMPALTQDYRTYPLRFEPRGDSRDGRIEITGTGAGSFRVAAVSLMRDDNVEGWNPEFLAAIAEMNPTMLRWGGNFSANYEWRDGIGDPDRRPTRYDYAWNAIEPNDVGTFEVLALNRLLGTEPNIGVNAGLGDAHSAAQWVEYVNGSVETPMGRLRAEHGHPAPFGVTWWGVGNEMYGEWQIGHMYIGHYVIKHNMFAERMREVDPSIILVATGASRYQMAADSRGRWRTPLDDKPPFEFDSPQDWTGWLVRHSWQHMDYISEHIYGAQADVAYDLRTQRWVDNPAALQDRLRQIPNRVQGVAEDWAEYNRRMPWLRDSGIRLVLDEWHAGGGDLFNGLWTGLVLNELFRHTDIYVMSAYTCAPCALAYDHFESPVLRAGGLVFKLYTNRLGTVPVLGVEGNSPQPELPGTVGVDRPRMSSGSPTYPLDVLPTLSNDGRTLAIAVVNPSERPQRLLLDVVRDGVTAGVEPGGRLWTITGPGIEARNVAGEAPEIELVEQAAASVGELLTVPPVSINVYELRLMADR